MQYIETEKDDTTSFLRVEGDLPKVSIHRPLLFDRGSTGIV